MAKRALVLLLRSLAAAYGVPIAVTRESADSDVLRACRKVVVKLHPDKGGSLADAQRLNAAKDEWEQKRRSKQPPGRKPKPPSPAAAQSSATRPGAATGPAATPLQLAGKPAILNTE